MIRNFGLTEEEITSREIRQSALGRWTLRIFATGLVFAVAQTALGYLILRESSNLQQVYKESKTQYAQLTSALKGIGEGENNAKAVINFRNGAAASFMPTGIYYAIADAIVPGMAVRSISLTHDTNDKEALAYQLIIKIGYDSRQESAGKFIKGFNSAMTRFYNKQVTITTSDTSPQKPRALKNTIYIEQNIRIKLVFAKGIKEDRA